MRSKAGGLDLPPPVSRDVTSNRTQRSILVHSNRVGIRAIPTEPAASVRAAEEIRIAILNGSLPPGTRVRQEDLAAKLGLSRVPIRQALVILEHEGLVRTTLRRGAIISPIDSSFIAEVYEFREIVESFAAARAADLRMDIAPLQEIVHLGRKAVKLGSLDELIDLDWRFHSALYEASGNRVLAKTMQAQWVHVRRAMLVTLASRGYRARVWDEHQAMIDAIAMGKSSSAGTLASRHARNARKRILGNITTSAVEDRG